MEYDKIKIVTMCMCKIYGMTIDVKNKHEIHVHDVSNAYLHEVFSN